MMTRLTPLAGHGQTARQEAGLSLTAALNDAFRRSFSGGQVMLTRGVAELGPHERLAVLDAVQRFDAFTSGCDPYGDHDFGAVDLAGVRYFWKIDAYDKSYAYGSPDAADPTDPAVTARVLTIIIVVIIDQNLVPLGTLGSGSLTSIYALVHLLPAMAVLVRHLHDIGCRYDGVHQRHRHRLLRASFHGGAEGHEGPHRSGPIRLRTKLVTALSSLGRRESTSRQR